MPKTVKGGPFEIFQHPFCCKISKNKGVSLGTLKSFERKSHKAEKGAIL